MPELDLNFGDVGVIPPAGTWRFISSNAVVKKNNEGDGFILTFDAMMIDAPEDKFEGFKVFPRPNASLKSSARWKLQECLEALTGEDWKDDNMKLQVDGDPNDGPVACATAEGKKFLGVCTHGEYKGRKQFKIDTFVVDNGSVQIGPALEAEPLSGI